MYNNYVTYVHTCVYTYYRTSTIMKNLPIKIPQPNIGVGKAVQIANVTEPGVPQHKEITNGVDKAVQTEIDTESEK